VQHNASESAEAYLISKMTDTSNGRMHITATTTIDVMIIKQ